MFLLWLHSSFFSSPFFVENGWRVRENIVQVVEEKTIMYQAIHVLCEYIFVVKSQCKISQIFLNFLFKFLTDYFSVVYLVEASLEGITDLMCCIICFANYINSKVLKQLDCILHPYIADPISMLPSTT